MDHPLIDLINARIAAAEADGAFDDLEGAGKPLAPSDSSGEHVINGILKRNGAVPPAVAASQEVARLRDELAETSDRAERRRLITEIALLDTKLEQLRRKP